MGIFKILQKRSRFFYLFMLILGLTNALWSNTLLLLINNKVNGVPLPVFKDHALPLFVCFVIVSYVVSRLFQTFVLKLTIDLGFEMGLQIFSKVRRANYERYIKFGKEKIYSLLSDTQVVSEFPASFIGIFNSFVIFVVALVYLFTISFLGAISVLAILIVLGIIYYYQTLIAEKSYRAQRELSDSYNRNIIDFLMGFKEMKMSIAKSDNIYDRLNTNRLLVKKLNMNTSLKWLNNDLLGRYFWFLLIGTILYILPQYFKMDAKVVGTFIITLLFLIGPVGTLIASIPYYSRIKIAMQRLNKFDIEVTHVDLIEKNEAMPEYLTAPFRELHLHGIEYHYSGEVQQEYNFSVYVPKIIINSGETIFITGGNGSGKTTFINILTGLYVPEAGEILYNGHPINIENYPYYRDRMAVIFSDHYLFSDNYENFWVHEDNQDLIEYIDYMKMQKIIKINSKNNKLEIDLSKGQQKRLSMIYALMENKDILVLDEWAADQDPIFRAYFYDTFLTVLKDMGKTIIMVTHDDRYYKYADRLIKFDSGRIVLDTEVKITTDV